MRDWAAAALVAAVLAGSPNPVAAEEIAVGSWTVVTEPGHAVAVLNDPDGIWTLLVRCTDEHLDLIVRRIDEVVTANRAIRHYQGALEIDGRPAARFPAQTWSAGGYLVLDVASLLPLLEAGLQFDFNFADEHQPAIQVSFLAGHTAAALEPVRDKCHTTVS